MKNDHKHLLVPKYCAFIEDMWKVGNDDVVNIVDVTIVERLSDDNEVWQRFGEHISEAFMRYINDEVRTYNIMMSHVPALCSKHETS